jgi:hypothetical protein
MEIAELLVHGAMYVEQSCSCGWSTEHTYAYMSLLRIEELWPTDVLKLSISGVIQRMEEMSDPMPVEQNDLCDNARWHREPNYRQSRRRELNKLKDKIGLCLDCVQSGSDVASQGCRIEH